MEKVLLISMPLGALERQALGISLLKANLQQRGYACDLRYFTFTFAEQVGFETYQWLMSELPYTAFAGDWLFTASLYGDRPLADLGYIDEILRYKWKLSEADIQRLLACRKFVPGFIETCLQSVPWEQYAIVGFTSTFEQNIASLALAQRLKQRYPHMAIVFGGANWEGEMGIELLAQFGFVDYACSGEADFTFPRLVELLFQGRQVEVEQVPGLVYRSSRGESAFTGEAQPVRQMDELPIPDFSDYFAALEGSTVGAYVLPHLLMETSRGCWWGAKSHCTFCGLNGNSMTFRSKSAGRAVQELLTLVDRWQLEMVEVVDNILDMRYFQDLLPALVNLQRHVQLFYEVKANLSREQVAMLREAGVFRIQPGIESLSDHILALMHKGTTALRNIQLMKWCKEYGLGVDWNLLYGFPGETQEDYDEMLRLLPAIRFLGPPSGYGPVRLDRFSPYFDHPQRYGLVNIRPMAAYKYLYPFDERSLMRIATYFDFDYDASVDPRGYASAAVAYIQDWQQNPEPGALIGILQEEGAYSGATGDQPPGGTLILQDSRSDAATTNHVYLQGLEKCAYQYCDQMRTLPAITRHLHTQHPQAQFSEQDVERFLESLVANRLMVTDHKHYLSLALNVAALEEAQTQKLVPTIQVLASV